MKRCFVLEILALFISVSTAYAGKPNTKHLVFEGKTHMTLNRFLGHADFQSTHAHAWQLNPNGKFSPHTAGTHTLVGFRDCESVLSKLQEYSLDKQVETERLTPEEAAFFKSLGTSLKPQQVNFFKITHVASSAEIQKYYDGRPGERISDVPIESQMGYENIATAAIWSVSGQIMEDGHLETVPLPWQKEESRKDTPLDRSKYKFVSEWGRAAQDIANEIKPLYAANAALNYVDVVANGGKLDDAWVMYESKKEGNSKTYLRSFPGSTYLPGGTGMSNMLFMIPLREMLAKFPPSTFSNDVGEIMSRSGGRISDVQALDILIANRLIRWDELDFTAANGIKQKTPIILNDVSIGKIIFTDKMLERYKLDPGTRVQIMDHLIPQVNPLLHSYNNGKYVDASDAVLTSHYYADKNAVEISNIDPKLAAENQKYVLNVLFASYVYYVQKIAASIFHTSSVSSEQVLQEAALALRKQKIRFGITTGDLHTANTVKALKPESYLVHPATTTDAGKPAAQEKENTHDYWFKDMHVAFFSIDDILRLAQENPILFDRSNFNLKPGYWRSQYLTSQTDLF